DASTPVSSRSSRTAASASVSPGSTRPPGKPQSPLSGGFARRTSSSLPARSTTASPPGVGTTPCIRPPGGGVVVGSRDIEQDWPRRALVCKRRGETAAQTGKSGPPPAWLGRSEAETRKEEPRRPRKRLGAENDEVFSHAMQMTLRRLVPDDRRRRLGSALRAHRAALAACRNHPPPFDQRTEARAVPAAGVTIPATIE